MKDEHLHLLINEEIYALDSSKLKVDSGQSEVERNQTEVDSSRQSVQVSEESVEIVFIHDSTKPDELELLAKIIEACKLKDGTFQVAKSGAEPNCKKAIVFTDEAKVYYEIKAEENRHVLYSKTLRELKESTDEKGKLWNKLKEFLS